MVFDSKHTTETEPEVYQGSASPHNVMVKHINQVLAAEHKHRVEFQQEQRQIEADKQARHARERTELTNQPIPTITPLPVQEDNDMNIKEFTSAAIVATSLLLGGCGDAKGPPKTAKTELYKRNPNPKQGYEITARINNPPGAFNFAHAGVLYWVENCDYVINEFAGAYAHPEQGFQLPLTKINDNEYSTKVYLDEMIDEDYYGKGVCHWQMSSAGFTFMATGAKDETSFHADVSHKDFPVTKPITYYFWNGYYPMVQKDDWEKEYDKKYGATPFPATPHKTLDVSPNKQKEFFSVTLTVTPISP